MTSFEESPKEECGVIGIFAPNEDVARMTYFGLYALQHRGQEAAGIAVSDGSTVRLHKDVGLVSQVFNSQNLGTLKGNYAIGHTRYSTTGSSQLRNAQPFLIETMYGPIAVAHNGNLVNSVELRNELLQHGVGLSSTSDTEIITLMLAGAKGDTWKERIQHVMSKWIGAYSLVILTRDHVLAVRDPWGFHPLNVGLLPSGGHAAASETGALRTLGCEAIREIKPGEIVELSNNALTIHQAMPPKNPLARCTFENIYFARPDNVWDGTSVHHIRQNLGKALAHETQIEADVVIPVPDSSIPAAIGYASESGILYNDGFIKNRYIGRTFIEPTDSLRKQGIALKFNVINENILNKRVIMVDDSIVRANTTGPLIKLLRNAGAKEVHVVISCPPITHQCYMGVDMGSQDDLVAAKHTIEEIRQRINANSLHFLSLEGMMQAIGKTSGYCNACFTGQYPFDINLQNTKTGFEKSIS
jgi:amidophosphoribosyltransferase